MTQEHKEGKKGGVSTFHLLFTIYYYSYAEVVSSTMNIP